MKCFEIQLHLKYTLLIYVWTLNMKCFEIIGRDTKSMDGFGMNLKHEMFWNMDGLLGV